MTVKLETNEFEKLKSSCKISSKPPYNIATALLKLLPVRKHGIFYCYGSLEVGERLWLT
ncbi:MAG: hypothetical protein Ct9H300mP28_22310 [Pseudomonadota bacterium]|nr:MAG: hypothetical protein Ct9H300mP28_22310 [Pseudomonadota bacterium]